MQTTVQTNSLRNVLKQSMEPVLQAGEYTVHFKEIKLVENASNPENEYLRVTTQVVPNGRTIVENKFSRGLPIMISHLRKQLGMENEKLESLESFLNTLIEEETEVKCWVTKVRLDSGREVTNINYLPPLDVKETEVVDDTLPL